MAPDGAVWFAEATSYSITRIKDGELTRYPFESVFGGPYGVAVAADGAVWATLQAGNQLLRIAPGRQPRDLQPAAPAGGADRHRGGARRRGLVRRVPRQQHRPLQGRPVRQLSRSPRRTPGSAASRWPPTARSGSACCAPRSLGRLRDDELETFKLPRDDARPYSLAVDRDGNVWYADIHGYVGMLPADQARE